MPRYLRLTHTGADVKALQTTLKLLGYYTNVVSGIFGAHTRKAVLAFQRDAGLTPDCIVGPLTQEALDKAVSKAALKLEDTLTSVPATSGDPGGPYLLFDLYPFDLDDPKTKKIENPDFKKVFGQPNIRGGILKATDGIQYRYTDWFVTNYQALKAVAGSEYGKTWFRGSYHYLQFHRDGKAQADYYTSTVAKAGGWDDGAIMPVVDIEFGGERALNRQASNQQIVDCAGAFVARCKEVAGRRVMLYGRGLMRDRALHSNFGCDVVWNPSYTRVMSVHGLVRLGEAPGPWTLNQIALWQYGGDGLGSRAHGLPLEITGFGKIDMNVHINGDQPTSLATFRAALI